MDLKEEAILGGAVGGHWYYVSKARALRQLLGRRRFRSLLDVGAGSGFFSRHLLEQGLAEAATCLDIGYGEDRDERVAGRPIRFRRGLDARGHDLALFMDVLEHVADDEELLRGHTAGLDAGAHVVVTVPAFQSLWSGHDVFLEHHRRYRLNQVSSLARRCDLEVLRGRYFYGLLFPVAAALRLGDRWRVGRGAEARSQLAPLPDSLNRALVELHRVEAHSLFHVNVLAGMSVFCLLRKK